MELLVKDVVRLLNVPENTVYAWIEEKKLPVCTVNGQIRVSKVDLLEWATQSGIALTAKFLGALSGQDLALPEMTEALERGNILYNIPGKDKPSVLRSVVKAITLPARVDRDFLLQVLLAREALGSTGVGDGIAIPHPRNPVVLNVDQPFLSLLFLEKPVEFDSIDKKPVTVLFTLISPTVRAHLHLLSRIAFALHNEGFKEKLKRQAPADDLFSDLKRIEGSLAQQRQS